MSTRNAHTQTDAEPTTDQPSSRPETRTQMPAQTTRSTTRLSARGTQSAAASAPRTFSHGHTDRLQNLVDRWNVAFADSKAETRT
ncbi:hypothetical protein [Natrarchaeobaculum aegyptiacum]|uniref:Uncharacterized protein n=1 Tax=Natrarchaeobaculum aegyptiacum TaxID=745377 RepID=A0A2Z2HVW9_9EURY|nr:hypothetical protein [Natrarchaeobaculum aegyptiacum]ARS90335.1 hypothetical protein B1756_11775 [Natrarchaeobaculum aegyptiacum]